MNRIDFGGDWKFRESSSSDWLEGHLPGLNYLDLMAAGKLEDPFWAQNEESAKEIGEKDFDYTRTFQVEAAFLQQDEITLVMEGLDTLATVRINDAKVGYYDNAHRIYRVPVKNFLKTGENTISIHFASPQKYIYEKNQENPMFSSGMARNATHIRKPECHFGWDWGPVLPPSGIHGSIALEGCSTARIADLRIEQEHVDGNVTLHLRETLEQFTTPVDGLWINTRLTSPDGTVLEHKVKAGVETAAQDIEVDDPQLWWCNGLGDQPLYHLTVELYASEDADTPLDRWEKTIGLRTIRLDTDPDQWGKNFCFFVNDVPVFAKGGNWVPSDSFVTRTTKEDLDFYIRSARDANMNMLRIWGGGFYESENFYDLCDQYGILVWQDCAFACMEYPLADEDFLENVHAEIHDQVRRLRHRASLALWCGNNEISMLGGLMFKKDRHQLHTDFFYNTLREWVRENDTITPYWQSSPSSNEATTKPTSLDEGDTHLWHVWHGLQPLESFRKKPTRFCSEFGVESLPSMLAIRSFTDQENPGLFDPVIQAHQKSVNGNEKMLYYILTKYRHPDTLEDFIYLSQLIQSETVRKATEFWRRNSERCHGSLYWQFNDTWPVASWAGIDYLKQYKALHYRARHFNSMVCISAEMHKNRAEVYGINDLREPFSGTYTWRIVDFNGNIIADHETEIDIKQNSSPKLETIVFKNVLNGTKKTDVALILEIKDPQGKLVSSQYNLLVADKLAGLHTPTYTTSITQDANQGTLSITPDHYSRYTWVRMDGVTEPLSDNFFDIEAGKKVEIRFTIPEGKSVREIEPRIMDLTSVGMKGSIANDRWQQMKIFMKPYNLLFAFFGKFFM